MNFPILTSAPPQAGHHSMWGGGGGGDVTLNNASEQGLRNLKLRTESKTAKNEHILYEWMCWDARLPRVDHYDCQTLQQCSSNAGAGGWHNALLNK